MQLHLDLKIIIIISLRYLDENYTIDYELVLLNIFFNINLKHFY